MSTPASQDLRQTPQTVSEPVLLALALAREEENTRELTAIMVPANASANDRLHARVLVTGIGIAVRLAFDEWARRAEHGETSSVRELYA